VTDTGIGIADSARATLFTPFEQAERGTSRQFGGSGLGLSIVSGLAERMRGHVEVHSILGQGSRFQVLLDLPLSPPASPNAPVPTPARGVRVVLAEDNRVNQEVFRALLESVGCRVRIAEHGKEALRLIAVEAPDLVLMDCQMPEMDGLTATRLLRESGFLGPIVALTANTTSADRAACLDAGMDDFLSKPATRAQLQAMVVRWGARAFSG
jgi:CheY-like chemotaxis protein